MRIALSILALLLLSVFGQPQKVFAFSAMDTTHNMQLQSSSMDAKVYNDDRMDCCEQADHKRFGKSQGLCQIDLMSFIPYFQTFQRRVKGPKTPIQTTNQLRSPVFELLRPPKFL